MVEEAVGARRFLYLWLAAIAVGGAAQLGWSFALGERFPTIGASGAVMAVVCAAAVLQPHTTVIFFVFPLKLRTFALLYVGLDLFQLLQGQGGTAYVVHLSGAALGFLAARRGWMWSDPLARMRERRQARTQRVRTAERERDEARLDRLLAQINEGGLASLSEADREFLRRVSATRREQTRDQGL
jgi:membrane associated rhomboid family serine protease